MGDVNSHEYYIMNRFLNENSFIWVSFLEAGSVIQLGRGFMGPASNFQKIFCANIGNLYSFKGQPGGCDPRNKVGAQLHDSLGPTSNLQQKKIVLTSETIALLFLRWFSQNYVESSN